MKKIYYAPKTVIVNVQLQQMVALSAELDSTRSITTSGGFGAREGDFWDDEDDYDE